MISVYLRRNIFKFFKKSRVLFCWYEWLTGYREIILEKHSYNMHSPKNKKQIALEKKLVNNYWRCGSFAYYRYGLSYKVLTNEELLNYVPTYYHHKKLEKDHSGIDTIKYGDKLVQCRLFAERGIPCPTTIAYYQNGVWRDLNNNRQIEIVEFIKTAFIHQDADKVFIKPTGGQGGEGICVIKHIEGGYIINGVFFSQMELHLKRKVTYIAQLGVKQSIQISNIYSGCVNTLRVIVQKEGAQMKMRTCSMRIGQNGSDVDNSCQGGLCIKVDVETGQLAECAKARYDGVTYERHPDTNTLFREIIIKDWGSIKKQIEVIATKIVEFNNVALDIALTEDGPILLEYNFRYGIEHQQIVLGGVKSLLRIGNK